MDGDLVSLRFLVVTAAPSQRKLWQKGAVMASVPIDYDAADSAATATAMLSRADVDICIVDQTLPDAEKKAVIAAARAARPAPLVFMSMPRGGQRPGDIDGVLARPANADGARKLFEICARAKIPTRVLIVDDSSTMRSIVRKILFASRFAFDVHEAAEGIAALEQLSSGNFGLVFLDYNMPGFNGIETLLEIKRVAPQLSVIMMTSAIDDAIVKRAKSSGALAFLKKPFYPADIDAVIERHYGLHMPDG
jgi:DNA-binding NtrC family response regulator